MSDPVIRTEALTKTYGNAMAVDHLDLTVEAGEVFGLLGPNGAGKTTTILMLLGLTEPTSGKATVAGYDPLRQPLEVKRRVGYMPDQVGFYDNLTGVVNLRYTAKLCGIPASEVDDRIQNALKRVELVAAEERAEVGLADERVVDELSGCALGDLSPVVEDVGAVGNTQGALHVLLHQQDGHALGRHLLNHLKNFVHHQGRQAH